MDSSYLLTVYEYSSSAQRLLVEGKIAEAIRANINAAHCAKKAYEEYVDGARNPPGEKGSQRESPQPEDIETLEAAAGPSLADKLLYEEDEVLRSIKMLYHQHLTKAKDLRLLLRLQEEDKKKKATKESHSGKPSRWRTKEAENVNQTGIMADSNPEAALSSLKGISASFDAFYNEVVALTGSLPLVAANHSTQSNSPEKTAEILQLVQRFQDSFPEQFDVTFRKFRTKVMQEIENSLKEMRMGDGNGDGNGDGK